MTILVFLAQAGIFLTISRWRLVDGDEGFYLMTSRLVTEGKLPYHDFLLTQMPLLPYVYGWWMRLTAMTWMSARLLCALLTAALGTALYSEVSKQTYKWSAGLLAVLLYVSSTLVFAWFTAVKTFALSTLLLFLAYQAVIRSSAARPRAWLVSAGLMLGASADVRLYFAGLLPVFLWWIYGHSKAGARSTALLCFLGGFTLATMPNLYLLARAPRAYFFGILGFHAIRSSAGLIGGFGVKMVIAARLVLRGGEGNGAQMALLFFLILILAVRPGIVTSATRLALALGLLLGLICLLPTPPMVQYFCVTVPFFILFVVCSMSRLLDTLQDRRKKGYLAAGCAIMLLVFTTSAVPGCRRFLSSGVGVTGIDPGRASDWRISGITAVSHSIDERIHPGERVMSLWPGYIFQSKAEPWAGLENNSATFLAEGLSPGQRTEYHVLSPSDIMAEIAAHAPKLVVLGNQDSMLVEAEPFERMLARSGYKLAVQIGNAQLWTVGAAGRID